MASLEDWTNTSVNDRIKAILDLRYKSNATKMAQSTYISRSTINNIVGPQQSLPGFQVIYNLLQSQFADVNPDWLIFGKGPMRRSDLQAQRDAEDRERLPLIPDLPVDAAAGFTDEIGSGVTPSMCRMLPKIPGIGDYDLTISVRGDSMEPSFISGDRLAIRRCRDVIEWGAAHVVDSDEGVYVKRIEDGETAITCLSDNPRYKPISIPKSSIRGIYKVVALFRAF